MTRTPHTDATCAAVRADLPGLDGSELSTRRATDVRAHLASCAGCADLASSYRQMRRTLADLALLPVEPPAGLLEDLLVRAEAPTLRERAAVYGRGAVSGARPTVIAAGAGVSAVAAAGIGVLAWRRLRRRAVAAG